MHQHRQIHVWISESDYLLLQEQSVVTRESVSALIRRFIKNERQRLKVKERSELQDARFDSTKPELVGSYLASLLTSPRSV